MKRFYKLIRLFCLVIRIRPLKAEAHEAERVHSLMRPYLARFCRRRRCFSRSVEMMVYFLELRFFLNITRGSWVSIPS